MWNLMFSKGSYEKYIRKQQDEKLQKSLKSIKSQIDTSCPKYVYCSPFRSPKQSKTLMERKTQIRTENKKLISKMLEIDLKARLTKKSKNETEKLKSLNSQTRKLKQEKISSTNKNNLQRIKSAESVYSVKEWQDFNDFHNHLKSNISKNPSFSVKKPSSRNFKIEKIFQTCPDEI